MNTHSDKTQENKNQVVVNGMSQKPTGGTSTFQFVDNRPETLVQRKLHSLANNGLQAMQTPQLKTIKANTPGNIVQKQGLEEEELLQGKFITVQKQGIEEEELLQGKFNPVQMKAPEEEELLQGKFKPIQKKASPEPSRRENNTGLPDNLKSGIENMSGYSMDDVKVNFNSNKPSQLNAHAYAQGTDIHVAPGQEKHLPHEAWHVVQQKQGRVKPTMQMKGNVNVNNDEGLEKEADVMGEKAFSMPHQLKSPEEEMLQRKFEVTQSHGHEEEELVQGKFHTVQKKESNTTPQSSKSHIVQRVATNLVPGLDENVPSTYDAANGHSYKDHGAHTTKVQHKQRLTNGTAPSGRVSPVPQGKGSSKFVSDEKHKEAFVQALTDIRNKNKPKQKVKGAANIITVAGAGITYMRDDTEVNSDKVQLDIQPVDDTTIRINSMYPTI